MHGSHLRQVIEAVLREKCKREWAEVPDRIRYINSAGKRAYQNQPAGFGMFLCKFRCWSRADRTPQKDNVCRAYPPLCDEIAECGSRIFVDALLIRSSRAARPVSAIVNHKEIGAQRMQRRQFSTDRLFQNVAVAVKHQQNLVGSSRRRDPPSMELLRPI